MVYIFERHSISSKVARASKADPHWKGPCKVVKQETPYTYWVRKVNNNRAKDVLVHVRHMKPYENEMQGLE